jgi:uncharacterized protein (TIGR03000 family)
MNKHNLAPSMGAVLAALAFFDMAVPASAQGLGYYPGYRAGYYGGGGLYGGSLYGGGYGAGYFGIYRGGFSGAGLYGGNLTGAAYLGTTPYVSGYGMNAPYAHAYPYAPYASAYRPYSSLTEFGSGTAAPTGRVFRLPDFTDASAGRDDKGHVVVRLPRANAQLLINGNKTKQRGKARRFVSDPLAKGRSRTYKFTARWKEQGTEVERTKTVTLRAGQRKVVQFKNSSGKKKKSE